jgi:hypothetical protein
MARSLAEKRGGHVRDTFAFHVTPSLARSAKCRKEGGKPSVRHIIITIASRRNGCCGGCIVMVVLLWWKIGIQVATPRCSDFHTNPSRMWFRLHPHRTYQRTSLTARFELRSGEGTPVHLFLLEMHPVATPSYDQSEPIVQDRYVRLTSDSTLCWVFVKGSASCRPQSAFSSRVVSSTHNVADLPQSHELTVTGVIAGSNSLTRSTCHTGAILYLCITITLCISPMSHFERRAKPCNSQCLISIHSVRKSALGTTDAERDQTIPARQACAAATKCTFSRSLRTSSETTAHPDGMHKYK